ncbi:hypothetical protein [Gordonia alkaliphila]|uniref:Uncharacterized protein n=1 Tax=Gordonia alkaliphila TaxID=1053547 RepID=A0ABP8Z6V4_9ACTN
MTTAPRPRHNEPTPGMDARRRAEPRAGRRSQSRRLPADVVRPAKTAGALGFVLLLATLGLVGATIAASVADWVLWPWVLATVVVGVGALLCLAVSRMTLTAHAGSDRAEHDPLVPEVTSEEAAEYERHHPHPGTDDRR